MPKEESKLNKKSILKIALVLFFSIVIIQFYFVFSISQSYSVMSSEYKNYKKLTEERISELENANEELRREIEELNSSYELLEGEIEPTIQKIEYYENELEDSMEWFDYNSAFNKNDTRFNRITSYFFEKCIRTEGEECYIKTACIWHINDEKLKYSYKNDVYTSGAEDKLQSLEEFLSNGGGDCEDYSFFYKAEHNSIINRCMNGGYTDVVIEAWVESDNTQERYWLDWREEEPDWYLPHASGVVLKEGYIYPNVICGEMYDLNEENFSGHCMIAFTREKIESIEDLNKLDGAPVIEPQDGYYMGEINEESSDIEMITEENYEGSFTSYVSEVITDKDYFLFSFDYGEWMSYSDFNNQLKEKKLELMKLKV